MIFAPVVDADPINSAMIADVEEFVTTSVDSPRQDAESMVGSPYE